MTAQSGVNVNNITFTVPTYVGTTDACEHGIGGYTKTRLVWRWPLPRELQGLFTINLLEFIAVVVNIKLILLDKPRNKRILCFTESSSALGWLHHSTFNPVTHPLHSTVTRHLARSLLDNECTLYSQHVKGKHNFLQTPCPEIIMSQQTC